eukprot:1153639-Pelagomonas_calceolata.AAC.1
MKCTILQYRTSTLYDQNSACGPLQKAVGSGRKGLQATGAVAEQGWCASFDILWPAPMHMWH